MTEFDEYIFVFRLSPHVVEDQKIQLQLINIGFNPSNLLLRGRGSFGDMTALNVILANKFGTGNVSFNFQKCEKKSEPENPPRAIGLSDLSQSNKGIVVFSMMAATCGADILARLLNCSREEVAEQIQMLVGEKFGQMSDEDINNAIAAVEKQERQKTDNKIIFVQI